MAFWERVKESVRVLRVGSPNVSDNSTDIAPGQLGTGRSPIKTAPEQIQFFKESGSNVMIEVKKVGIGLIRRNWSCAEVDPLQFGIDLADEYGGGSFELTFSIDAKPVRLKNGNPLVCYLQMMSLPGERKMKSLGEKGLELKAAATAAKPLINSDTINAFLVGLPALLTTCVLPFFKSLMDGRAPPQTVNDLLEGMVKLKQLNGDGDGLDPFMMVERTMELVNKVVSSATPPVVTGQAGGGFGGALGNIVEAGMRGLAAYQAGQGAIPGAATPPALAAGTPQGPHLVPTTPGAPPQPTAEPTGGVTINPLLFLVEKFKERTDPQEMAQYALQCMDNMATYLPDKVPAEWRQLEQMPGQSFDRLCMLYPGLQEDPGYVARVREYVLTYFSSEETEAAPGLDTVITEAAQEPETVIEVVENVVESSDNQIPPEPEPKGTVSGVEPEGSG